MMNVPSDQKPCATCVNANHEICQTLRHFDNGRRYPFQKSINMATTDPKTFMHYRTLTTLTLYGKPWIAIMGREGKIDRSKSGPQIKWLDLFSVVFMPSPLKISNLFISEQRGSEKKSPFSVISRRVPSEAVVSKITERLKEGNIPITLIFTGENPSCQVKHLSVSDPAWTGLFENTKVNLARLCPKEVVKHILCNGESA